MKKLTVISAALIAMSFAGIAQAQESSLHRDAVIAELQAARASGELAAIQGESQRNGYQSDYARRMNGMAVAQEATSTTRTEAAAPAAGAKTRAEVIAELKAARASGELASIQNQGRRNGYQKDYMSPNKPVSATQQGAAAAAPVVGKTRAEVVAELQAARVSGELAVIQSNGYYTPAQARVNTTTVVAGQPRNPQ